MRNQYGLPIPNPYPLVVHGAIAVLDAALTADLGRDELTVTEKLGILRRGFFQSHNMLLGNDEHVGRRFGVDVFEGEHLVVFVHLLRRNFPCDDLAEEAVIHGSMLSDEKHFSHGFLRTITDRESARSARDPRLFPLCDLAAVVRLIINVL